MKISISFIPIGLFLFLIVSGSILMIGASFFFYQLSINRFLEEKEANLKVVANTITSPYWIHQEVVFFSGVTRFFIREASKTPDVIFIRIIDEFSGKITVSNNLNEEGLVIANLPKFVEEVSIRDGVYKNQEIKELSIQTSSGRQLWMGISTKEVAREILVVSLLIGLGILILFGAAGFIIFIASNILLLRPLFLLRDSFLKVGKEQYKTRLKDTLLIEMKEVFTAFNAMTEKLGKIRARERLIAESKSQFIDIAAHQIRTPTSTSKWVFSTLLSGDAGKLNKQQNELINKANTANNRFIRLISDMLNVDRIGEDRLGYKFSYAKPETIVREVVEDLRLMAKGKNLQYTYIPPQESIQPILLDVYLIKLAITNLIENAIHYTPPGKEISITLIKTSDGFQVSVKDAGIGIPKNQQQRVFEKFFRATNATNLYTEGTGLGLYLVKNIIDRHKGRIWFKSEEGVGTTFFMEIPHLSDQ